MSSRPLGPIKTAWYKWKSLRWVPGRKRFLVGLDLHGNTFWEFRDTLSSHKLRMRRIVQYPTTAHLSDVNVSPQWLQWLRHTRKEAPSLTEQSNDVVRQENLKILAARADQRWAAKPSFLDQPGRERGQPVSALGIDMSVGSTEGVGEADVATAEVREGADVPVNEESSRRQSGRIAPERVKEDPWKQAKAGPSEEWQPQAWGSGKAAVRR